MLLVWPIPSYSCISSLHAATHREVQPALIHAYAHVRINLRTKNLSRTAVACACKRSLFHQICSIQFCTVVNCSGSQTVTTARVLQQYNLYCTTDPIFEFLVTISCQQRTSSNVRIRLLIDETVTIHQCYVNDVLRLWQLGSRV